ncbi:hypothetical protein ACCT11_35785, partial [Rhizobium johnstonii]|uniref:hypothetical protein n=1 Tax=Rhizobium johnstonii TaxID=3019933 RepID=UPI003F951917
GWTRSIIISATSCSGAIRRTSQMRMMQASMPPTATPTACRTTVKNDQWYDTKDLKIDGAKFFVLEDQEAALKRYRAGSP